MDDLLVPCTQVADQLLLTSDFNPNEYRGEISRNEPENFNWTIWDTFRSGFRKPFAESANVSVGFYPTCC